MSQLQCELKEYQEILTDLEKEISMWIEKAD